MRTIKYSGFFVLVAMMFLITFNACKKSDSTPDYNSDKSQLSKTIDSLMLVYDAAKEGNKPGNYATGAKANIKQLLTLLHQSLRVRHSPSNRWTMRWQT